MSPEAVPKALPNTPHARLRIALGLLIVLALADALAGLAGWVGAPWNAFRQDLPLFSAALFGATVIQLGARRERREWAATLVLAAVLSLTRRLVQGPVEGIWAVSQLASSAGMASLLVLAAQALIQVGPAREEALDALRPALVLVLAPAVASSLLGLTPALRPDTLDAFVLRADGAFGLQPSWILARFLDRNPGVQALTLFAYLAAPAALGFAYVVQARARRGPVALDVLSATLVASALSLPLYTLFPVVGPSLAFPDGFPEREPLLGASPLGWMAVVTHQPRNCMPSLHATWALLVWWHTRGQPRWVRALAGGFLFLTLLATMGLGLHYAVDLVAAVPFTVAVRAALVPGLPRARRLPPALGGAALLGAWMALLRWGVGALESSRLLAWGAAGATVILALVLHARVARAEAALTVERAVAPEPRVAVEAA